MVNDFGFLGGIPGTNFFYQQHTVRRMAVYPQLCEQFARFHTFVMTRKLQTPAFLGLNVCLVGDVRQFSATSFLLIYNFQGECIRWRCAFCGRVPPNLLVSSTKPYKGSVKEQTAGHFQAS